MYRNRLTAIALCTFLFFPFPSRADSKSELLGRHESPAFTEYKKGVQQLQRGQVDQAEATFSHALSLDADFALARVGLADVALSRGQKQAAEQQMQKALALAPRSPMVQRAWGHLLYGEGKRAEAEAALSRTIQLAPQWAAPRVDLGDVYMMQNKPAEAISAYRAALALEPDNAGAHFALGVALARTGESKGAAAEYKIAAEKSPNNPLPPQQLGLLFLHDKRYGEAIEALNEAVRRQPSLGSSYVLRGDAFFLQGEADKASADYKKATDVAPKSGIAYVRLGKLYESRRDWRAAEDAYRSALRVDSNYVPAMTSLALLQADRRANAEEALQLATRASKLQPQVSFVQDAVGWVAYARGDKKAALQALTKATSMKPVAPEAYYHLAVVLQDLGEKPQAEANLRKALSNGSDFHGAEDARNRLRALGSSK